MIKAVLDEGTPRKLASLLTAADIGVAAFPNIWKGTLNGRLIDLVEAAGFSLLITCDKRVPFQQNLRGRQVGVLVLPTPDIAMLERHIETITDAIRVTRAGRITIATFDPIR